jgi:predicted RNA binding protein YcfA (HicA-like mRNA interferase family)
VKRRELVRRLAELGAVFVREGGGHTIYQNPRTQDTIAVPRHAEIAEILAKKILRDASR